MNSQTKWIMGIIGGVLVVALGAFFTRTSTTLDRLVTDVAVIKALGEKQANENLPPRVAALEGVVTRLSAQVGAMETNRWTRGDHQAYERLIEVRFTRNEKNIDALLESLKDTKPADVLAAVRELKAQIEAMKESK